MAIRESNNDIQLFKVFMDPGVTEPLNEVILSGKLSQYEKVTEFEKHLSAYIGNSNLLTMNSATSALHLAYHLLKSPIPELKFPGLDLNDEVLTTPLTCVATNWPILANNLKIKWVDINKNLNLDIIDLKQKLSKKTKIISIVHWGGYPANLDELKDVQRYCEEKFGFRPIIIEDCAHSFGAEYKGQKLGNHGNIVIYSFQAIKHLTCGDGGLLVLPIKELYERGKLLRWFGISRETKNKQKDFKVEDNIKEYGFKFHMNDINATIGLHNLPFSVENLRIHRDNASYYLKEFNDINCVELLETNLNINAAWWTFTFFINNLNEFISFMKKKNINVSQVHGRNDNHDTVSEFKVKLPNLDKILERLICIPVGWWITHDDRKYIVQCIKEWDKLLEK
uniref:DegT/DnrJ/EryC1/StrS aminotransferase family protein n=1 Tax=viral metagenome TaxID=1070528 RepID=A0A6C0BWE1_9ZZZZ